MDEDNLVRQCGLAVKHIMHKLKITQQCTYHIDLL